MEFDTIGLGAGSYPEPPEEEKMKTVEVECSFTTWMLVPENCEDKERYIKENYSVFELIEEVDEVNIENVF